MDKSFHPVAKLRDLPEESASAFTIAGRPVLLCRHLGGLFALENRCSHMDSPLECGRMRNGWILCPAHGARFDLATGEALGGPTEEPIAIFAVRVVDGIVEVGL